MLIIIRSSNIIKQICRRSAVNLPFPTQQDALKFIATGTHGSPLGIEHG
jgi:hypothetical protein